MRNRTKGDGAPRSRRHCLSNPIVVEWPYLIRLLGWCKKHSINVWLDLHTAPGSQNGFDNSGQTLSKPTGLGWSNSVENVNSTLDVIAAICEEIKKDPNSDIVKGFGLLNEPFKAENEAVVKDFDQRGLQVVRSILGEVRTCEDEPIVLPTPSTFLTTTKYTFHATCFASLVTGRHGLHRRHVRRPTVPGGQILGGGEGAKLRGAKRRATHS